MRNYEVSRLYGVMSFCNSIRDEVIINFFFDSSHEVELKFQGRVEVTHVQIDKRVIFVVRHV